MKNFRLLQWEQPRSVRQVLRALWTERCEVLGTLAGSAVNSFHTNELGLNPLHDQAVSNAQDLPALG